MVQDQAETVSARIADWSREAPQRLWDPSRRLLRAIRKYQSWRGRRGPVAYLARRWWANQHRLWSLVTQCEIYIEAEIGGGLIMPHPNGIILHPDSRIGPNCMIFQQVTLAAGETGSPVIGGHVDIGAGAKILGAVTIGDHARIGANAVVLQDVPAYCTAVGIPAKILPPREQRAVIPLPAPVPGRAPATRSYG